MVKQEGSGSIQPCGTVWGLSSPNIRCKVSNFQGAVLDGLNPPCRTGWGWPERSFRKYVSTGSN
uniref:Uncharacterized protein n=1 Tax=Picea glauca TaxID=3330 RepID=A0A101M3M5_PICGL|nr:hypothetical protein ABT39_MTgene322 [Picea glauca]QHR90680.1 hypothetical protein Q903MT_gene4705 [Picea sitchensis]